jgi:hypothetical protein
MLRLKRRTAWTVPMMLQVAMLSAGPLVASEQEGDVVVLAVSAVDDVKDVVVTAKPADDDGEDADDDGEGSEVRPAPPVLKARTVKARPTKAEPSDVRETEVIRRGPTYAIKGGRMTVKSADGRTFEIVASEGPMPMPEGKVAPGKPGGVGRALTILRTPDGGTKVLEANQVDTLIDDLTFNIKEKIAAEAPKFIIGVSVSEAPKVLMVQLGKDEEVAVVVDSVMDDSPAAKAGVKQYDLILKAAGEPVHSAPQLTKAVKSSDGKAIELVLLRAGKELKVDITPRPNEPVRHTKLSDGVIHFGPAVMERRAMGPGEAMFGPGALQEEMKALRKDMAELKEMMEKLKAEK